MKADFRKWSPNIQSAAVVAKDKFCIAFAKLEYDDPFSMIIFYDGTLTQPWGRVDVRREITAILPFEGTKDDRGFKAISNEGDIYPNLPSSEWAEIPGAGVSRAGGHGALYALGHYQGDVVAVGMEGQIYRQHNNEWSQIDPEISPPTGYKLPTYATVGNVLDKELYICGAVFADVKPYDVTQDPEFSSSMSNEALTKLFMKNISSTLPAKGFGVHFDGESWRNLALDRFSPVTSLFIEDPSKIWMVGPNGMILFGSADSGFKDISFHGDSHINLLSITKFKDQIIIASDHGLHIFDGFRLTALKPTFSIGKTVTTPTPFKIQAIDDVMFYFDYRHGVYRWNGKNWSEIVIPPLLLEREFKGLNHK